MRSVSPVSPRLGTASRFILRFAVYLGKEQNAATPVSQLDSPSEARDSMGRPPKVHCRLRRSDAVIGWLEA